MKNRVIRKEDQLYFFLERLDDIRKKAPSKQPFYIDPIGDLDSNLTEVEIERLTNKLGNEEKIIQVLETPYERNPFIEALSFPHIPSIKDRMYLIKLLPKFNKYYSNVQKEEGYKEFINKKIVDSQLANKAENKQKDNDVVYEIKYSPLVRRILINGFLLSRPESFGDNDILFNYLYSNPNQDKSIGDITKETDIKEINLNKFVENIGFIGDLREVFFTVSQKKGIIRFNNPITRSFLSELGVSYLKLN